VQTSKKFAAGSLTDFPTAQTASHAKTILQFMLLVTIVCYRAEFLLFQPFSSTDGITRLFVETPKGQVTTSARPVSFFKAKRNWYTSSWAGLL
jgi:hypothetical protein